MKLIHFISSLFLNLYSKKRLLLVCIFFLSFLFSLVFLLFFSNVGPSQHSLPGSDYLNIYEPVTRNLLKGEGFVLEGKTCTVVPPGYPLILSVIFSFSKLTGIQDLRLITVFNMLVAAFSAVFLFLIAESVFKKRIALIASFLWMSYPFNLWLIKNPNTEVPFIFLLYLGIFLYISALKKKEFKLLFWGGTVLGLASLIRPISIFLPLILGFLLFYLLRGFAKTRIILAVLCLLLGTVMAVLPWESYVFFKTGKIILISSLGSSTTLTYGLTYALITVEGGERAAVPSDVLLLMERIKSGGLDTMGKVFDFCLQELFSRPVAFLKLMGLKITRVWYATSQMWLEKETLLVQTSYLLLGITGICCAVKKYKEKIRDMILLLCIVLYFWLMAALAVSILRYMIPVMGFIMIFSAMATDALINRLTKRNKVNLTTNS